MATHFSLKDTRGKPEKTGGALWGVLQDVAKISGLITTPCCPNTSEKHLNLRDVHFSYTVSSVRHIMAEEIHRIPLQAYVERKTKSRFMPIWRRWYCVLNGRLLLFYKCQTDYQDIATFHDVMDMGLVYDVTEAHGVEHGISISSHTGQVLLRFRKASSCQIWLSSLEAARVLKDTSENHQKRFSRQRSREHNIKSHKDSLTDGTPPPATCQPEDIPSLKTGPRYSTLDGRLSQLYEPIEEEQDLSSADPATNEVFVATRSLERTSRIRKMANLSYASLTNFMQFGRGSSHEIVASDKTEPKSRVSKLNLSPSPQRSPRSSRPNLPTNANVGRFLAVASEETTTSVPNESDPPAQPIAQSLQVSTTAPPANNVPDVVRQTSSDSADNKRKKTPRRKSSLSLIKSFFRIGKKDHSHETTSQQVPKTTPASPKSETTKLTDVKPTITIKQASNECVNPPETANEQSATKESVKLWVESARDGVPSASCYSAPPNLPAWRFSGNLDPSINDTRPLSLYQPSDNTPPQLPVKSNVPKMRPRSPHHDTPRSTPVSTETSSCTEEIEPSTTAEIVENFEETVITPENAGLSLAGDTDVNNRDNAMVQPDPDAEWIDPASPTGNEVDTVSNNEWGNSIGIDSGLTEPLLAEESESTNSNSGSIVKAETEISAKVVEVILGDGEKLEPLPVLKRRNSDYDIPRPHPVALLRKQAEEEQHEKDVVLQATRFLETECLELVSQPSQNATQENQPDSQAIPDDSLAKQDEPVRPEEVVEDTTSESARNSSQEMRAVLVRSESKVSELVRHFDRSTSEEEHVSERKRSFSRENAEKRMSFAATTVLLVEEEIAADLPPLSP